MIFKVPIKKRGSGWVAPYKRSIANCQLCEPYLFIRDMTLQNRCLRQAGKASVSSWRNHNAILTLEDLILRNRVGSRPRFISVKSALVTLPASSRLLLIGERR
ncbi:hypothetical protein D3C77_533460 [compost metagenome]